VIDVAWRNYFGTSHSFHETHRFVSHTGEESISEGSLADPLEL
jgi:hypothetical protein